MYSPRLSNRLNYRVIQFCSWQHSNINSISNYIYVCMSVLMWVHTPQHNLGGKSLYPLSNLASPARVIFTPKFPPPGRAPVCPEPQKGFPGCSAPVVLSISGFSPVCKHSLSIYTQFGVDMDGYPFPFQCSGGTLKLTQTQGQVGLSVSLKPPLSTSELWPF